MSSILAAPLTGRTEQQVASEKGRSYRRVSAEKQDTRALTRNLQQLIFAMIADGLAVYA
jgi:hypothetical protein